MKPAIFWNQSHEIWVILHSETNQIIKFEPNMKLIWAFPRSLYVVEEL